MHVSCAVTLFWTTLDKVGVVVTNLSGLEVQLSMSRYQRFHTGATTL